MTLAQSWKEEGIQIGIEKGKLEAKIELVKSLCKMGIDLMTISKATELTIEEINKITGKN